MTRPVAVRILVLAAAIGFVAQWLLFGNLLGINAPILAAGLLGAAFLLRPAGRRIDPLDRWLAPAALAISLGIAVRADPFLLVLDVLAACALLGASVAAIAGEAVTRRSAARVVELGFIVLGWAGIGILRVASAIGRVDPASNGDDRASRLPPWAWAVARGLVIAIPLLLIFGSLFSSADVAFDQLMGRLFTWNVDLGEVPIRLAVGFFIAWGVAGLLAVASGAVGLADSVAARAEQTPLAQSLGAAAVGPARAGRVAGGVRRAAAGPARRDRVGHGPDRGRRPVRRVRGPPAGLPVRRSGHAGGDRPALRPVRPERLLRARLGRAPRRRSARDDPRARDLPDRRAGRRRHGACRPDGGRARLGAAPAADLPGRVRLDRAPLLRPRHDRVARDRDRDHGRSCCIATGWAGSSTGSRSRRSSFSARSTSSVRRASSPSRTLPASSTRRLVPPDGQTGLDVTYAVSLGDDAVPALVAALPALDPADRAELTRRLQVRRERLEEQEATAWAAWNVGREQARQALAGLPAR